MPRARSGVSSADPRTQSRGSSPHEREATASARRRCRSRRAAHAPAQRLRLPERGTVAAACGRRLPAEAGPIEGPAATKRLPQTQPPAGESRSATAWTARCGGTRARRGKETEAGARPARPQSVRRARSARTRLYSTRTSFHPSRSVLAPPVRPEPPQAQRREGEPVQGKAPERAQERERAASQPVAGVQPPGKEGWRAASRVPAEGWGHSVTEAVRVGRRTSPRRRPECRGERTESRARARPSGRRRRGDRPRAGSRPS